MARSQIARAIRSSGLPTLVPAVFDAVRNQTAGVRRVQDKQAPKDDRQISYFERVRFGDGRAWVCSQANGQVLELACGTACNLPFYRRDVQVIGIELSPQMLAIAYKRALELGHTAALRLGDVPPLNFPDESFDTIVHTSPQQPAVGARV